MVTNLDVGVRRALVAYFKEQGIEDASEAAERNLSAGCDFVMQAARSSSHKPTVALKTAFHELKGWAAERAEVARRERAEVVRAQRIAEEEARVAETKRLLAEEAERAETERLEALKLASLLDEATPERAVTEEIEIEHLAELVAESSEPKPFDLFPGEADAEKPTAESKAKKSKKKK